MSTSTLIPGVTAIRDFVGKPLGPSDWVEVTQERIQLFAEATGDHQWIHVDPERARRESPFGAPVAHGLLTLSLMPTLLARILRVEGVDTILNTGVERMRLSTPVPAGSRVRMRAEIKRVRDMPRGGVHATLALEIEVEGAAKPACRGEVSVVYLPPA